MGARAASPSAVLVAQGRGCLGSPAGCITAGF